MRTRSRFFLLKIGQTHVGEPFQPSPVSGFRLARTIRHSAQFTALASQETHDQIGLFERIRSKDQAFANMLAHSGISLRLASFRRRVLYNQSTSLHAERGLPCKKTLGRVLLLLACASMAFAQTGSIQGTVLDAIRIFGAQR